MKPPLPEGVFKEIAAAYEAHAEDCISLPFMWLGRRGGVSCPSDLNDCDECQVTFYIEGLGWVNWNEPPEIDEVRLCGCCAIKRGITLRRTPYGIATEPA